MIDKESPLFKNIHDHEDVRSISASLSMLKKSFEQRKTKKRRPRAHLDSSESEEISDDEDNEDIPEEFEKDPLNSSSESEPEYLNAEGEISAGKLHSIN